MHSIDVLRSVCFPCGPVKRSLIHLYFLHVIDGIVNNQIIENLEFYVCAHVALFFFPRCHWNPPRCAVDVLRRVQLHQLDRHPLVLQPQQHGASVLLQERHRVQRQAWSARPAQPAGTGRPGSGCLAWITLIRLEQSWLEGFLPVF